MRTSVKCTRCGADIPASNVALCASCKAEAEWREKQSHEVALYLQTQREIAEFEEKTGYHIDPAFFHTAKQFLNAGMHRTMVGPLFGTRSNFPRR